MELEELKAEAAAIVEECGILEEIDQLFESDYDEWDISVLSRAVVMQIEARFAIKMIERFKPSAQLPRQ